jgi:5-methylcytosine-specific restriction endonuclease McrA
MDDPQDSTKRCPKCGLVKPRGEFGRRKDRADGVRSHCRLCDNARRKRDPEKEKARGLARRAAERANKPVVVRKPKASRPKYGHRRGQPPFVPTEQDRELVRSLTAGGSSVRVIAARLGLSRNTLRKNFGTELRRTTRALPTARSGKSSDYDKEAARARRKRLPEADRLYRLANPERTTATHHRRRAKERSAAGSWAAADIQEIRRMQRDKCAVCRKPLKGKGDVDHIIALANGGSNDRRNLQLLCHSCNSSKQARCPVEFMQSRGLLI